MTSMTQQGPNRQVFARVETHADTHHAAVVDVFGRHLDDREFPTSLHGVTSAATSWPRSEDESGARWCAARDMAADTGAPNNSDRASAVRLAGQELVHEQAGHDRPLPRPVRRGSVDLGGGLPAGDVPARATARDYLVDAHAQRDWFDVEHLRPLGAHHGSGPRVPPTPPRAAEVVRRSRPITAGTGRRDAGRILTVSVGGGWPGAGWQDRCWSRLRGMCVTRKLTDPRSRGVFRGMCPHVLVVGTGAGPGLGVKA